MSTLIKIIGILILLGGAVSMYFTSMNSANETIESGRMFPTTEQFWENITDMVVGGIIMFIGGVILTINAWIDRRSSN